MTQKRGNLLSLYQYIVIDSLPNVNVPTIIMYHFRHPLFTLDDKEIQLKVFHMEYKNLQKKVKASAPMPKTG